MKNLPESLFYAVTIVLTTEKVIDVTIEILFLPSVTTALLSKVVFMGV